MADRNFPWRNTQQEWVARATEIAQRELAPRAAETNRAREFSITTVGCAQARGVAGNCGSLVSTEDWSRTS